MKDQGNNPLTGFKVFIDGTEEKLDGKKTVKAFPFNTKVAKIVVKKEKYVESSQLEHTIKDTKEANNVPVTLNIKRVIF